MQTTLSPPTTLWCADGLSVSIDGPGLQQRYSVDKPYLLIGASPKADVVLPLAESSPVALYLHVTDDAIAWLDLSSPIGQWRSGAFAKTGCLVWRGYHIALERVRHTHRSPTTSSADRELLLPDDRPSDVPVFNIEFDGEQLARAKLTSSMTLVGQSQRCRLRLRNRHVSYDHCLYYVADRHAWVIDLLSDEGTFVRGQRVAAAPVLAGDVVTIGKPTMTLRRWSEGKSSSGVNLQSSHQAPRDEAPPTDVNNEITVDEAEQETSLPVVANNDAQSAASQPPIAAEAAIEAPAEVAATTEARDEPQPAEPTSKTPPRSLTDTTVESASLRDTVFDHPSPPSPEVEALPPTSKLQAPTPDRRPLIPVPQPPVPDPRPLTPDPSLDRLIDRHKVNHRRTLVRWSIASSVSLAAFLSAVVWGSRNIDFYDDGPAFPSESPRSENEPKPPAHRATPPSRPPSGLSSGTFTDDLAPQLNDSPAGPTLE
jgi:pSer/pThr/pTyr-binding forkhead associated (FHA) protein